MCATKLDENTINYLSCYFQTKFSLSPIKQNTFMWEIKFSSHKQYLFDPFFSMKAKKTCTVQSTLQVFFRCLNRNDSQVTAPKIIFSIQLASMNVF